MLKREDIRIRDPFIFTDKENGCYYMYGTTALKPSTLHCNNTFSVYKTYDLESFEEPKTVLDGGALGLWSDRDYWAPEVYFYNGKYYLFGSMKSDSHHRATQIFVCDTPDGEFKPVSTPMTPEDWECLDGTFYIEDGVPYMVFSHEWTQIKDGEIWAMPMTDDLSAPAGAPFKLFAASEAPDVTPIRGDCYITDGPFLYREDGKLKMIWSSSAKGKYAVLEAEADSIHGVWAHKGSRFDFDGGHAMLFYTLEGKRMISLHAPNKADYERAVFFEY